MLSKGLVAASTKPLILSILQYHESYGYQIIMKVKALSGGFLQWSEGTLYPVLHRMEKDRLIKSQWKMSDSGRPRKYYQITESGIEELALEKEHWTKVNEIMVKSWTEDSVFEKSAGGEKHV